MNFRIAEKLWELFEKRSTPLTQPVGRSPQGSSLKGNLLKVNSLLRASAKARHVEGRLLFSPLRRSSLLEGMPLRLPFAGRGPSVGFSPLGLAWPRWSGLAPF